MGKKSKRKTGKKNKKDSNGGIDNNGGGKATAASNNNASKEDKELDKKCDERLAELQYAEKACEGKELQFSVGDRVLCTISRDTLDGVDDIDFGSSIEDITARFMSSMRHLPGTIVQLGYCERGKKDMIYPYQIRLDEDDKLIWAPSEDSIMKTNLPPPPMTQHEKLLFAQPPHREDCPICMIPLPLHHTKQTNYFSCCGKVICLGCIEHGRESGLKDICPFCRAPKVYGKEIDKRIEKRIKSNDPEAIAWAAVMSWRGDTPDGKKCLQLMTKAAELGLCTAHYNLGFAYSPLNNEGPSEDIVERDSEKAIFHLEKAAIAGHGEARYRLALSYCDKGSLSFLSLKHLIVGAKSGYAQCLHGVKKGFVDGMVTKADFEETLRMYKESLDEVSSEQRDKAAVLNPCKWVDTY